MSEQRNKQDLLRQAAEAKLVRTPPADSQEQAADKFLHELQVHQIELEMQNESLRESEAALTESRDHYIDFYNFAPVGFITLSREALITEINFAGATLLGDERHNLLQHRFSPFVALEDQDSWYRYFVLVLQRDTTQTCEIAIQRQDGSRMPAQLDSIRLVKNGKIAGMRMVMSDITVRKNYALIQTANEERYRSIVQDQTEVIGRIREDGTVIFANDVYCRFFGLQKEDIIGSKWHPLVHPDDLPIIEAQLRTLSSANPVVDIENRVYSGEGALRWMHFVNRGIFNAKKQLVEIQCVGRDITERKETELALHKAQERLLQSTRETEDLYNNAPCGYHSIGPDGTFLRINKTELEWLGYTREELIGKMKVTDCLTPQSEAYFRLSFPKLKELGHVQDLEVDMVRKDGSIFPVLISATVITDEHGNFLKSRTISYNMTEHKRWSETVSKLSGHLQSSIEEERTRISREIHDQLGSQLAAIKLGVRWLSNRIFKKGVVTTKKIQGLDQLITETMQSVREISTQLRPSILDNLGLLPAIEWKLEQFKLSTGIECEVILPTDEVIHLSSDQASAVYRILQESLTNITLHAQASKVCVEVRQDRDELTMIITDNGIGIPASQLMNPNSFGLIGMTERTRHFGGMLNISGKANMGTVIELHMPPNDIPGGTSA